MNPASSAARARKLSPSQQRLVERHLSLVDQVVGPLQARAPAHVRGELGSIGRQGLVLAARAFDEARDVPFEGFARVHMRGFVRNELRRSSVAANDVVGGADRDGALSAGEGEVEGWAPTVDAAYAGEMLGRVTSEASCRASRGPDLELAERRDGARELACLASARDELDPRPREVLRLRWDEGLGWREVARHVGVSVATARRDHDAALAWVERRLRARGVERDAMRRRPRRRLPGRLRGKVAP